MACWLQEAHRRPRRHDKGDDEREDHRRRRADRNRPHVRAHQAADEGHGQNGRHHGERGQDGGVAHFVHGAKGDGGEPVRLARAQLRMSHDVLHHHDRIVDEDADGEDQGEERDAVERVAVEKEHEQRERQRDRNRDQDHRRLASAEHEPDERRHREHRQQHVPQQFVTLLRGRLTVVAGDREVHVRGHERALERLEFLRHVMRHVDGVGPLALGHGDRDRWLGAGLA